MVNPTSSSDAEVLSATVLLVDDDVDARQIIALGLGALGYNVLTADSGEQAMRKCEQALPDLIVTDVMMPGISGIDFVLWFRRTFLSPYIPVILLTALADVNHRIDGLNSGADDYVTKPFHYKELHARIQAALRVRKLTQDLLRRTEELKEANGRLVAMQQELVAKERQLLAAQLAVGVSHTIRQPLTALVLQGAMLKKIADDSGKAPSLGTREELFETAQAITRLCGEIDDALQSLNRVDTNAVEYVGTVSMLNITATSK